LQGHQTTPTLPPEKSDLTKQEVKFGELLLAGLDRTEAAAKVWPALKRPATRATRIWKRVSFQRWYRARKEISFQLIREITARHSADYEARIEQLAEAFSNPDTKWREKLQIHDKLTAAEGRKAVTKERSSDNVLADIAKAAGLGAALGASVSDGRFPHLRPVFPEDKGQTGRIATLPALAAPRTDVGGPKVAD